MILCECLYVCMYVYVSNSHSHTCTTIYTISLFLVHLCYLFRMYSVSFTHPSLFLLFAALFSSYIQYGALFRRFILEYTFRRGWAQRERERERERERWREQTYRQKYVSKRTGTHTDKHINRDIYIHTYTHTYAHKQRDTQRQKKSHKMAIFLWSNTTDKDGWVKLTEYILNR